MILNFLKRAFIGPLLLICFFVCSAHAEDLTSKGRRLYLSNCIQCHNKDPNLKGSIGPAMVDAPIEVMTSKVMTGLYPNPLPAGFVPKKTTKSMRKIPKLQKDIPAIYAWVQSVKKKK